MSVIRIGSNKQYADGWELIFGGSRRGKKSPKPSATKSSAAKPKARAGKAKKAGSAAAKQAKSGPARKAKKGRKAAAR